VVEDPDANTFTQGHTVFVQGPVDSPDGLFARELGCQALKGSELFCSVAALGEPTQNMLFLGTSDNLGAILVINDSPAAILQASNFTLIPVTGK